MGEGVCKENDITFYAYMVWIQGALTGSYDAVSHIRQTVTGQGHMGGRK